MKLFRKIRKKNDIYLAKIGCWNCDEIYELSIKKGENLPEYLIANDPLCRKCGCDSLKPYIEWTTEKEIMKDLVLHHRIEQLSKDDEDEDNKVNSNHDHFK